MILPKFIAALRKQSPNLKLIVLDFAIDRLRALMEIGKVNPFIVFLGYIVDSSEVIKWLLNSLKSIMLVWHLPIQC